MRRREFITLAGSLAVAWPLAARAQQPGKVARLGYIWIGPRDSAEHSTLDGLRQGLRELGYAERKDFIIEDRYADSKPERLADIVAELVRLKVDLILSPGNLVVQAAMEGTSTIPIIATTPDLLASGFIASLAHPGGNVTGISLTAGAELSQKWLEIAQEIVANLTKVGVLWNSSSSSSAAYMERMREAGSALGIRVESFGARNPEELDRALSAIEAGSVGALIVESDAGLVSNRAKILAFVAKHRVPAIYGNQDYMPDGGLIAYATSIAETWHRLATYVDRVLKGAKPGDLPVEQATNFALIVNLRTAKALGLNIPNTLIGRADEVIE